MTTEQLLLSIDPLDLKFTLELNKSISTSFQLINKTDNHVAFKVKTTNPRKYTVRPNSGIVLPRSRSNVTVTMQPQMELPPDMQCKDKFLVQSVIVDPGSTPKDINPDMFNKPGGNDVEECKLKVIYVSPPRKPSPVPEDSEEGTSPTASDTDLQEHSEPQDNSVKVCYGGHVKH
uniref:Vesicle-associated membrane protein n=1 Tax=Solanum tuberosum TaxID=4113 RepID=M1BY73_SOLTU